MIGCIVARMLLTFVAATVVSCFPEQVKIVAIPGRNDVDLRTLVNGPTGEVPLSDGHFDVDVSRSMFQNSSRTFTVRWIDFYR